MAFKKEKKKAITYCYIEKNHVKVICDKKKIDRMCGLESLNCRRKKNLGLACIQFTIYFESRLTCTIFAQLHKQFMNSLAMKASIWVWLDSNIYLKTFLV